MDNSANRDVAAPAEALAWAGGHGTVPGRWLYDEMSIAAARSRGEVIHPTEFDSASGRAWLRGVTGDAPLADLIHVRADLDHLRSTLVDITEEAAAALSAGNG